MQDGILAAATSLYGSQQEEGKVTQSSPSYLIKTTQTQLFLSGCIVVTGNQVTKFLFSLKGSGELALQEIIGKQVVL